MPTLIIAFTLLALALSSPASAGVSCSPQASGVSGVIADQTDMIAAVNCLGQQLAELEGFAFARNHVSSRSPATSAAPVGIDIEQHHHGKEGDGKPQQDADETFGADEAEHGRRW